MVAKENIERKKIFNWGEKKLDVVELEVAVYRFVFMLAREIMKGILEATDQELAKSRDISELRDKGYRKTVLKSIFGEVEYRRHVYVFTRKKKTRPATLYLLDEAMGLSSIGTYSETMCQMAVESACTTSYRNAAGFLSNMTGQTISHQTVWNIVQSIGEQEQHRVDELAEAAKTNTSTGEYQTSILYEEMDGVYLALQGKDRTEYGASKELKVSIAYSGVSVDKNDRRSLANKVAYAGFEDATAFKNHTEGIVAEYYDVDSIKKRIFNSDGGAWLKQSMVPGCVFQLDLYHRNKAVRTYVRNKEQQHIILSLLRKKQIDEALTVIEAYGNSTLDENEQENFRKLYSYFYNHRKALVPYYERRKKYPAPNDGQIAASCGSMESNIFTIIGNRMKHNRTVWSIAGANNLAVLLALKHTGRLDEAFGKWTFPSGWFAEETVEVIFTPSKIQEFAGEGYNGYHHFNGTDCIKGIRTALSLLPFSEVTI